MGAEDSAGRPAGLEGDESIGRTTAAAAKQTSPNPMATARAPMGLSFHRL
jgi:hypothetical protein